MCPQFQLMLEYMDHGLIDNLGLHLDGLCNAFVDNDWNRIAKVSGWD
jgi:hypothetical protein